MSGATKEASWHHGRCAVQGEAVTPREARTMWLEREVESLKEQLEREASKNKSFSTSGYWNVQFLTDAARAGETSEAVAYMKRNAGIGNSEGSSSQHAENMRFMIGSSFSMDLVPIHSMIGLSCSVILVKYVLLIGL